MDTVAIPEQKLADFCQRYHIKHLALFGSALHGDFHEGSDLDVLVEFTSGHVPGLLSMAQIEIELSELVGHQVDLRTPAELSRHFRTRVIEEARTLYASG